MQENNQTVSDEAVLAALRDEARCERLVFANEALCNAVIARYLDELSARSQVPVVRGFAALSPLPKPTTLAQAKQIVDGNL